MTTLINPSLQKHFMGTPNLYAIFSGKQNQISCQFFNCCQLFLPFSQQIYPADECETSSLTNGTFAKVKSINEENHSVPLRYRAITFPRGRKLPTFKIYGCWLRGRSLLILWTLARNASMLSPYLHCPDAAGWKAWRNAPILLQQLPGSSSSLGTEPQFNLFQ